MEVDGYGNRTLLWLLGNNRSAAERSAARLASGVKIVGAQDDSAAYAISEKMRVRLRALEQDRRNSENGRALLRTAEGGLQRMTELLKQMKGLAVQSANGIYTDEDRRIMDEEYQHCIRQMDDIATTTNHNGKYLLDGSLTVHERQGSVSNAARVEAATYTEATVGGVRTVTVTSDGRFTIPAGFTGDIVVRARNVLIDQATSAALTGVSIQCGAGTNLFIENLNIQTVNRDGAEGKSIIDFQGAGNSLVLRGRSTLRGTYMTSGIPIKGASLVHVGAGTELTINAERNGAIDMEKRFTDTNDSSDVGGAVLGGNASESGGTITINGGDIRAVDGAAGNAAAIGGGASDGSNLVGTRGGDITINGGNITAVGGDGAAIGGGSDITGMTTSDGGNITINGGNVNASVSGDTMYAAAIGGGNMGSGGTVVLNGGTVVAYVPPLLVDDGSGNLVPDLDPNNIRRPVGPGSGGAGGSVAAHNGSYTVSGTDGYAQTGRYSGAWTPPAVTLPTLPMRDGGTSTRWQREDGGLQIQTGTRSNQVVKCYIDDMHAQALGLGGSRLLTQRAAAELLGGRDAKGALDAALERVVLQTTQVGAYQARLLQTEATLTVDVENTTAAESTIRDANLAREMTQYAKYNLLAQAGQSMLAQANQQKSNILSLLQ